MVVSQSTICIEESVHSLVGVQCVHTHTHVLEHSQHIFSLNDVDTCISFIDKGVYLDALNANVSLIDALPYYI